MSLKLTAMGLDISEELCVVVMHDVLDRARRATARSCASTWKASAYTERTLKLFEDRLYPAYKDNVGDRAPELPLPHVRRTWSARSSSVPRAPVQGRVQGAGVGRVSREEGRRRELCAVHARAACDTGNYPGIATHDPAIIDEAKRFVEGAADRPRRDSSSRCCTACAAICRSSSCATDIACASMCPSARSGIRISCAAWPSGPRTWHSSRAT